MAMPPEVHSALLSSGPGPGPLLATAAAWSSLSAEYVAAAEELTGLLGSVQAGVWEGPSAQRYVAAHRPYLGWLLESAAKSTVTATLHQTVAGAYTAALATMPTLAELAANHALHATLVATNFFGINTIPIALNEADYVRMWIQAAETMTGYQAVADSALAAVPATAPAPPVLAPGGEATGAQQQAGTAAGSSWQDQLAALIQDYTQDFAWPLGKLLYPYGWPIPAVPFADAVASALMQIPGMSPALAAAVAWAAFHTLMIVWSVGQSAVQLSVAAALPATITAAGVAGGAGIAVPLAPNVFDVDGSMPTAAAAPAPAGSAPAAAPVGGLPTTVLTSPAAPSPTVPGPSATMGSTPAAGGPGVGFGPSASNTFGAGTAATDPLYAVSASGLPACSPNSSRVRSQVQLPAADTAADPVAVAGSAREQARARRRRPAGLNDRGHEYMDLEDDSGADPSAPPARYAVSDRGAGPLGFAGTEPMTDQRAAGLATLSGDRFGSGPAAPMLPGSWRRM